MGIYLASVTCFVISGLIIIITVRHLHLAAAFFFQSDLQVRYEASNKSKGGGKTSKAKCHEEKCFLRLKSQIKENDDGSPVFRALH